MWRMPWAVLQRIMADGPKYNTAPEGKPQEKEQKLTAESAAEILAKAKRS